MSNTTRSRYQTIWDKLKSDGSVSIAAPSAGHSRLKEAVKKRKKRDLAYKFLLGEQNRTATLGFNSNGSLLHITLTTKSRSLFL